MLRPGARDYWKTEKKSGKNNLGGRMTEKLRSRDQVTKSQGN